MKFSHFLRTLPFFITPLAALADGPGRIISKYLNQDSALTANPNAPHWKGVKGVIAENDSLGKPTPHHRTEIRSRWTDKNVYFLFIGRYQQLNVTKNPKLAEETNKLWDRDVAEVFIGADFTNIRHYREYQVSPQGEWVDLDINRDRPKPEGGWLWDSGMKVKARIDRKRKIWYGEMQIPLVSIDPKPVRPGAEMRVNFYRIQGPEPARKFIAWQPTGTPSYHEPKAFGRIVFSE